MFELEGVVEFIALTAIADADLTCFTDSERKMIDTICAKTKDLSAHDISELSHNEPAWQRHLREEGTIPYEEAFQLVTV